jgi:hypothetical protein
MTTTEQERKDDIHEQHLASMVHVLRRFLGNAATSGQWQKEMQAHGGAGWSKAAFKRRLKMLKTRQWVRIVGGPDAVGVEKVPQGALYETTCLAPVYSDELDSKPGSELAHEPGDESDRLINVAIQQLERLKRGNPSAA